MSKERTSIPLQAFDVVVTYAKTYKVSAINKDQARKLALANQELAGDSGLIERLGTLVRATKQPEPMS